MPYKSKRVEKKMFLKCKNNVYRVKKRLQCLYIEFKKSKLLFVVLCFFSIAYFPLRSESSQLLENQHPLAMYLAFIGENWEVFCNF